MVFSSVPFIFFFLPLFLILYYLTGRRARNIVLIVFSLIFYAWGEPVYILLMIFSTLVDYTCGRLQERFDDRNGLRGLCLIAALTINLGLLGFFKYADFLTGIWNGLTGMDIPLPGVALPVGISFYTFQTMSYSIDVYRRKVSAEHSYPDYLAYVSMFPQLIAGPIVRYSTISRELKSRVTDREGFVSGMHRFVIGLARKVLIADQLGALWDTIRSASDVSAVSAWLGVLTFTLQLYFDFSAYSDMAIGLAAMMGFHLPENFNYPLCATSITDFWHRWHISLSTWFRDYVYIPLGGNRVGIPKHFRNMFVVWLLTGLWHGASWNYVIWGLYHGIFLALEKYVWGRALEKAPRLLKHLYTLVIVVIGFGIFTFEDLHELTAYFPKLICLGGTAAVGGDFLWYIRNYAVVLIPALVLAFPVYPAVRNRLDRSSKEAASLIHIGAGIAVIFVFVLSVAAMVSDTYSPFLYFRF